MDRKYTATVLIGRMGCEVGDRHRTTRLIKSIVLPSGEESAWSEELHDVIEAYEARCHEERTGQISSRPTSVDGRKTLPIMPPVEDAAE